MFFSDRLTLDTPKRTKEGFLAVRAKAARAGVYDYRGSEIDPTGKHFKPDQTVHVYRSADEVFNPTAVHSFLLKPITDNHPTVPVTADNWKQHARGVAAGAMRDGDFLAFDLVLMDAGAIAAVDSGKRELSNGYSSEVDIGAGVAPDGTHYDAVQRNIRGNHIALVDKGRAGPECCIGDAASCNSIDVGVLDQLIHDGQTYRADAPRDNLSHHSSTPRGEIRMKTITVDGMPIEVNDQAEAVIRKLEGQLDAIDGAKGQADADVARLTTELSTKDAELVTAKAQLDAAKLSPQQLRDAAKVYQATVDKAKVLGVKVADDMDEAAIVRAVVTARVGDACKEWNDLQFAASFASLAVDAKPIDPMRQALSNGSVVISDTSSIRDGARASRYAN